MIHQTTPLDVMWYIGCFLTALIGWVGFIGSAIGVILWKRGWLK